MQIREDLAHKELLNCGNRFGAEKENIYFLIRKMQMKSLIPRLVYELSALKPLVEPLLRQIAFGSEGYLEAKRLLAFSGMVFTDQ